MALTLRVVSHSEIGLVRKNNQDSGYASQRLLVVADGMGGAAAGDLASAVAVDTLMRVADGVSGDAMLATMAEAVATANDRIADLVESDGSLDGMGTTVTAALFDGVELGLAHIGDSRAYLLRDGRLTRLTHDHSWVQSLVDEGKISEDEAAVHPHRSLLLRVLNGQPSNEPELTRLSVSDGDRLMFCSDGLCGLVDDPAIAADLARPDRTDALDALVAAARAEGGVDNITVIVADVVETAEGLQGVAADASATPADPQAPRVLGAAAEREIPATAERTVRVEAVEDTVVTNRVRLDGAPPPTVTGGAATTGPPAAEDEARYDPRPPGRRPLLRPLLGLVVVLLVVGAGLGTAYAWTRTQYYVGESGTQVAIYQGLADGLPGISLSKLYEVQPLTVAELPPYYQEKVRASIDVSSLAAARETVTELREAVQRCSGATPTPSPSPTGPASSSPRATVTPRATISPPASTSPAKVTPGPVTDRPRTGLLMAEAMPLTVVPRKRRGIEATLIVFALVIALGAYAQVDLNVGGRISDDLPVVAGGAVLAALVAHLAVRWRLPYADPVILPCVVLLNGLGLAMIHRIDLISSPVAHGARQQLIWTGLGLAMFVGVAVVLRDHRPLQRFTYTLGLAGIVLLLLPLAPGIGTAKFGAQIWIQVGPYSFQPAEAAKVLLAIAFAAYLVEHREVLALAGYRLLGIDLPRARDLGPILVMWLLSLAILVLQRDLGTSLLFFGLFVMMLYVSTERAGWPILGTLLFAAGAYFGYLNFGHVRVRVGAWLHPFSDYDAYYQVISAQFGMAWGGLLGTGLGEGRPGLTPLARSDFIAAAIGEELGMTGLMAVVMIYGLVVARGLRTALQCREPFGKLLASGLAFAFALQVFAIIGGVTRLLPLTGLTTPFMSQGGSSMICNWIVVGLLMVISHHARKPVATVSEPDPDPNLEQTQLVRVTA